MSNLDKAKKYYPVLWTKSMLKAMVKNNKLTIAEYEDVTGEPYTE